MEDVQDEPSDHESDDEPIGLRKRSERVAAHRFPPDSPPETKRPKPDSNLAQNLQPALQNSPLLEKLDKWTPQLLEDRAEFAAPLTSHTSHFLLCVITMYRRECLDVRTEVLMGLGDGVDARKGMGVVFDLERFPFLRPDRIQDANGRRPGETGYDPSSLYIPPSWFNEHNVSPGQRQWWMFKASNFDALLLFKVGKFYEMYEMDALVAIEALELNQMKGDRPHCGFPEAAYSQMAASLAEKGYKVAVIEQTETPEQLKERNQKLKAQGRSQSKVVSRQKVATITKGTMRDAEMIADAPDANYLMSIFADRQEDGHYQFGFCAVDVASSQFLLGHFKDDDLLTQLRTQIATLRPVEFILPASEEEIFQTLRRSVTQSAPGSRLNTLAIDCSGFCTANIAAQMLRSYFSSEENTKQPPVPDCLQALFAKPADFAALLSACGAVVHFLKEAVLDEAIIPISHFSVHLSSESSFERCEDPEHVLLDSSAIENLELFADSDGKVAGSLLASLDHCNTPFGKRLLKKWIAKPLVRVADIEARQDAIDDLLTTAAAAAGKARQKLAAVGDLERLIVHLYSASLKGAQSGRYAEHVILYEDIAKKKVIELSAALEGLQNAVDAIQSFQHVSSDLRSPLLQNIITPGKSFPIMTEALMQLKSSVHWEQAKKTGRVTPAPGVVFEYDAALDRKREVEKQLEAFLTDLRRVTGVRGTQEVSLQAVKKDKYVVEFVERLIPQVPESFELVSKRKGYRRFTCPQLKTLCKELDKADESCDSAASRVLHDLLAKFVYHHETWTAAVGCIAQLDVLMSLAVASLGTEKPTCRPKLIPHSEIAAPVFKATKLGHPNLSTAGNFVRNDIHLGGAKANFLVLTGANMGGKSTVLRQICLATILAQVGAFVPAKSLELTPVDRIFVRMGARDRIVCGQSTFFVELFETATMLKNATRRSLVALDELGRGTATTDGEAIAHAVLHYLSTDVQCCGLFATHYHALARSFEHSPHITVQHMACDVMHSPETHGGLPDVKFLYKLTGGVAPKSYGMNVARLAGLTNSVIQRANMISALKGGKGKQEENA